MIADPMFLDNLPLDLSMFDSWSRPGIVVTSFLSGCAYLGVLAVYCYAPETADIELVPLGAVCAPTTTVTISVPSGVAFVANMSGDELIKQVREVADQKLLKVLSL